MSGMGNGKHLAAGDAEPPPPAKDVLRVYGMRFCPFVHRLKLVLAAKGIEHESVNCNLQKKPEFLLTKNPRGKVPVIEKNGEIVCESDITSDFVDEAYQGKRKVITSDPLRRAKERMLLGDLEKCTPGFFGTVMAKNEEARGDALAKLRSALASLADYLATTGQPFICGQRPGTSDYMVWPFLERTQAALPEVITGDVTKYVSRMGEDEAVIKCRHSDELHRQFLESYRGASATYDIGDVADRAVVLVC